MRLAAILTLLLPFAVSAAQLPKPGPMDPRIRTIVYNPREVFVIKGHYGFQQMIQLADDEKVESLSIGDSLAWQVTPNKAGNLLFLKPVEPKAHTNLSVITNRRSYAFELIAINLIAQIARTTYIVRFQYPQDEDARMQARLRNEAQEVVPQRQVDPSNWNLDYTFQGKSGLAPVRVFDDGQFTYFEFRNTQDAPAIFLVADGENESLLNYHVSGKYLVVERLGRQFTLRSREGRVCVYNEAAYKAEPAAARSQMPQLSGRANGVE
jgi:type IV secretion system protein VirB9